MARDIKFRAWDKKKRRIRDVKTLHIGTNKIIVSYKGGDDGMPTHVGGNYSLASGEYELMQFTGLLDKTGKEAYEKDFDADGNMIDWCEQCAGYQFFQIDVPTTDVIFCHACEGNFMLRDHIEDFVIAGNIYAGVNAPTV